MRLGSWARDRYAHLAAQLRRLKAWLDVELTRFEELFFAGALLLFLLLLDLVWELGKLFGAGMRMPEGM